MACFLSVVIGCNCSCHSCIRFWHFYILQSSIFCSLVVSIVSICFFLSFQLQITLTEPMGAIFVPVSFKTSATFVMSREITFVILVMSSQFLCNAFLFSNMETYLFSYDETFFKQWNASYTCPSNNFLSVLVTTLMVCSVWSYFCNGTKKHL